LDAAAVGSFTSSAAVGSFTSSAACRLCELDLPPTWNIKKYAYSLIHLYYLHMLLEAILDFGGHIEFI